MNCGYLEENLSNLQLIPLIKKRMLGICEIEALTRIYKTNKSGSLYEYVLLVFI